jgi:predicted acetyltransferase
MIEEWKKFETTPTSPTVLFRGNDYDDFLKIIEQNVISNQLGVPATLFFFMEDENILWAIQVRHHIDHPRLSLEWEGHGHIGYWLRPSARGKWLASEMLRLWLIEAKKLGIETVVISADEDNPASWRTIEKCGWKLIDMKVNDGKNQKIYTIELWI